jgi:hypothetical protein
LLRQKALLPTLQNHPLRLFVESMQAKEAACKDKEGEIMTEADYLKLCRERGGVVGPSLAETMAASTLIRETVEKMSEEDFQQAVIEYAQERGWKVAHFRKARTKKGWRTAVAADGKGFPDLVLVRNRIVWAELKSEAGEMSPDQENWRDWLKESGQEWYCWKPSDWPTIIQVLA